MEKVVIKRRKDAISPNNRLVESYIYGSRGISPRNLLVKSDFYDDDEITPVRVISLRLKIKRQLQKLLRK